MVVGDCFFYLINLKYFISFNNIFQYLLMYNVDKYFNRDKQISFCIIWILFFKWFSSGW